MSTHTLNPPKTFTNFWLQWRQKHLQSIHGMTVLKYRCHEVFVCHFKLLHSNINLTFIWASETTARFHISHQFCVSQCPQWAGILLALLHHHQCLLPGRHLLKKLHALCEWYTISLSTVEFWQLLAKCVGNERELSKSHTGVSQASNGMNCLLMFRTYCKCWWLSTVVFPGAFGLFECAIVLHARTRVIVQT